jgi:hypothetical protein
MAGSILDILNIPRELTLDFLATFSRFEFALKKAGYVEGNEKNVSPAWDSFANDVAKLGPTVLTPVLASCPYLQQHPPKKQILKDGRLQWVIRQGTSGSPIGDALLSVRTVRNNVFHGGKFPDGPITEPLRDEQLIRECLTLLDSLLNSPLPNNVADHFKPE